MTGARPATLTTLVARRILVFAGLAMMLQVGLVFLDYWSDDEELGRIMIERETTAIAATLRLQGGVPVVDGEAPEIGRYTGLAPPGTGETDPGEISDDAEIADHVRPATFVRVRDAAGATLYSNCPEECREHFLPERRDPPDFWVRTIERGKPLSVAGGRAFLVGGQRVFVEVAILHDPDDFLAVILLHEMFDHMLVPMSLMLVLVIGATILSIRKALAPVAAAAAAADRLDPGAPTAIVASARMPREIAHFAEAINRLFARTRDLIVAQKVFAAAIAHEIRTPVAIVALELARIADPRARRAEADLGRLMHTLEQLTALAKLDAVEASAFVDADLAALAAETVAEMAPLVVERGKQIGFEGADGVVVRLVPALIQNVVRNLVENSLKHTPPGTMIVVRVEAPGDLTVADDGGGIGGDENVTVEAGRIKKSGALGMGLRIVERIAEIHGAKVTVASEPGRGTAVRFAFARR